jgi:nanoRNase/pAp phosphatase (c-di-AMP/oligoRNAs hydrolase)
MFEPNQISSLKSTLDQAKSIVIALPPDPDIDLISAGLSLYYSLSTNKTVKIGCSSPIKVATARLFGLDQIQTSIGNQNLVISFDYAEEKLDKIDYEKTEEGKVRLLIKPRPGENAPDSKSIQFSYAGANADLIIVLGVQTLEELGKLYSDEKTFFDQANILSINLSNQPNSHAKYSLHTASASCLSEIAAFIIKNTGLSLTPDPASNLLIAISDATGNYTSLKTTAETFDLTAFLLRQGGRRLPSLAQQPSFVQPQPIVTPVATPTPNPAIQNQNQPVPSDWKKPKIFHSADQSIK